MARIRSIHPGLFTDEAFMSASPYARLMIIGIWGEAWDDGVFEWKPLTIKAKLFPVDVVDASALLDELERLEFLKRFSAGGKQFGAVRNFCKWQRPKKPNSSRVLPGDLRTYVALSGDSSEPVPNQPPTPSEKSPQMEDVGGRMDDEGGKEKAAAALFDLNFEIECENAAGFGPLSGFSKIRELAREGIDPKSRIIPIVHTVADDLRKAGKRPDSWLYFAPAIRDPDRKPRASAIAPIQLEGFYAAAGTPQLEAWQDFKRRTTGKSPPLDAKGGWRFATEWPPKDSEAAA